MGFKLINCLAIRHVLNKHRFDWLSNWFNEGCLTAVVNQATDAVSMRAFFPCILLMILAGFSKPAQAHVCFDTLNAINTLPPKGWELSREGMKQTGLCAVYVQGGTTFDTSPVVMYPRLVPLGEKETFKGFIDADLARFREKKNDVKVAQLAEIRSRLGPKYQVYRLFDGPSPGEFEYIGYLPVRGAVYLFVASGRKRVDVEKSFGAFTTALTSTAEALPEFKAGAEDSICKKDNWDESDLRSIKSAQEFEKSNEGKKALASLRRDVHPLSVIYAILKLCGERHSPTSAVRLEWLLSFSSSRKLTRKVIGSNREICECVGLRLPDRARSGDFRAGMRFHTVLKVDKPEPESK